MRLQSFSRRAHTIGFELKLRGKHLGCTFCIFPQQRLVNQTKGAYKDVSLYTE
jgi:hypothetical protein